MKQMETLVAKMEALVTEKDQALEERAVMAEELKHRVRNNLQLIHGMLENHLKITSTPEEKKSIYSIIWRVMSVAKVYEQLLGTGMSRVIELGEYLKALCASLPDLQHIKNTDVKLTCDASLVLVDIDIATALGMAVAELVSNSFEHAFVGSDGCIHVTLNAAGNDTRGTVTVSDDGKGFIEQAGSKRHGVGLVRRLLQQIDGEAEMQSSHGTVWTLRFPVAPLVRDQARLDARL
jgi:two-component sensor histidine kinase